MWKTLLLFLSVAALTCQGYAQSDLRTKALDNKPGLDKPLTLTLRAVSLHDLLDKVETETKVRMRPDREITEDKVTIRVKEMPARDLLRAVAKCCNLGWVDAEIGDLQFLNLYMDRESQAAMNKKLYDDYAIMLGQFDKEMKATADAVRSKAEIVIPPAGSIPNDELYRLQYRSMYASDPQLGSMAVQYLSLTETQKKTLFDGKEVHVSADLICKEALDLYPEATGYTYWVERSLAGYLLQGSVQPVLPENEWHLIAIALFDDARYDKLIATECDALGKDEKLTKQITLPKVEPTPTPAPPTPPVDATGVPQVVMPVIPPLPKPYEGSGATPRTMSDALLTIAEAADMPLVAQYLSEYSPPNTPAPVSGKLSNLLAAQCKLHKFTVVRDGDVLQARAALWHRLHDREVPENTIKRWQVAINGLPLPTFETYVEMASSTWGQIRGIIGNYAYWFGASEPPGLAMAEYACKLYSSLTPTQQRNLWNGQNLPVSAFRADQQNTFVQAFEHKARPSYVKAKDRAWQATSFFKLRRASTGELFAFANGQILGTESIPPTMIPEDGNNNESFARIQSPSPEDIAKTIATLLDNVYQAHPETPRKSIAVYQAGQIYFDTYIGEDNNTTAVYALQQVN